MGTRRSPRFVAGTAVFVAAATLALSAQLSTASFLNVASAEPASQIYAPGSTPSPITARQALLLQDRAVVLRLVNRARAAHHLVPLRLNVSLSLLARKHSVQMMRAGTLFHTANLTQRMLSRTQATVWGENIAMGPSLRSINTAWLNSAPHRANILNPRYRRAAIGVALYGGHYWITFDFYG
jgi:uncharacterized protein YkwD